MRRAGLFAMLLAALGMAQAQQPQRPPDAGIIQREMQQPRPAPARPAPPVPRIETPERPALSAPAAARFRVKVIRVTGNTVFPAAQLEALVSEFAGKELGLAELQEAAARITRHYRENGYPVARAYLPAQDVRDGVVEIAVLEGRYGKVQLENRSRVNDDTVRRYVAPLRPGSPIESKSLERSLLLLSDLPGVAMPDAVLRPGANTGESDLGLSLEPAPLVSGNVSGDGYGNRYTGYWRASGSFSLASPTGYGDLFTAQATTAGEGLNSQRVAYQLPVGGDGLRLGAAYSNTTYELRKQFSPLDATGYARVATFGATYPFVRSLGLNVTGVLAYDAKRLEDRVGAVDAEVRKRNDGGTAGVNGNWLDSGGTASNSFSLAVVKGQLHIDSATARRIDDAGPDTAGSFNKVSYQISRLQQFGGQLAGFVSLSGQKANKNLDSSEKFLLGGPFGVRSYPQGEAAGDDAFVFTAELRYRVPQDLVDSLELVALFDYGKSHIYHNAFASGDNTRELSGAGIGINITSGPGWLLRSAWSWRTSSEPATSDTPRAGRGWLQIVKFF
jgi:hemolysin activation/secretion protein